MRNSIIFLAIISSYLACEVIMYKLLQTERKIQIRANFSVILVLIYGFTICLKVILFKSDISIYEAAIIGVFLFQALCDWNNQYIYSIFFELVIIINMIIICFSFNKLNLQICLILAATILVISLSNKLLKLFGRGDEMSYIVMAMIFFIKTPDVFFQKFLIALIVSLVLFLIVNIKKYIKKEKNKFPMIPEIAFSFILFI